MAGELLQGEFHRGGGVTAETLSLKQFGKFQQSVLFIIYQENLLSQGRGRHGVFLIQGKSQVL
ncbi:hypothetical protein D3C77_287420 [compost metagenome]